MAKSSGNPQIYHYLKRYQEDPTSRVFAPLAEAYRKAGLYEEAIKIAREGLRLHPQFIGGKVALARALFDKGDHHEVIETLEPVVQDAPDNIIAQKLLAESYLVLGRFKDALSAYKVLLFFMPGDSEVSGIVQEIESRAYSSGDIPLIQGGDFDVAQFEIRSATDAIYGSVEIKRIKWMQRVQRLQGFLVNVKSNRLMRLRS